MKQLFLAAVAASVLAGVVPALAAEGTPGSAMRPDSGKDQAERQARREQWCKANPEKCKEMQARMEQCKANPEKCNAERQARREQWCKANPEKCKEMQARREQWCKDNPERCGQMKARMEERRKQCEANPSDCRPGGRPAGKI